MIREQTEFKVADNSGAQRVECFRIRGGKSATIGDRIQVAVKSAAPDRRVKKGETHLAVIVRTRQGICRADGTKIKFDTNAVVLINNQGDPIGTRIFGPVTRELRAGYMRIVSLAPEVL